MKFFNKKLNKKLVVSVISTAFLLFLGSAQFTHASVVSDIFGGFSSEAVSGLSAMITYLIAMIFAIVIAIEAWVIGVVLSINASVLQTTFVQTGFSISLSIVNLAFVLGIIVIALATILRSQTYGIKQLLWKLVVMAIIVNFGLVIMSPIFALGNSFSQYFLNCINPGAGSCTSSSGSSFMNFGTTMASAFNPQNPWVATNAAPNATGTAALQSSGFSGAFSPTGSSLGTAVVPIFGMVFVVIDLLLIVVVLGVFIGLLTIRYLYIAILAILLPFAWASWVFPSFSSHWKKWWELFIRWTFFAPVVLFFIYLALLTMQGNGSAGAFNVTAYQSGGAWTGISNFLSAAFSPIISSFLQEILLGGLIVGGMIAANSMGIKMAGTVVDVAKKGGNAAGGYIKKKTKGIAVDRLRTAGRKYNSETRETTSFGQRLGSSLRGVPGLKKAGSTLANYTAPKAVQEERKEDIKHYIDANLKNLTNSGLKARATSKTAFLDPNTTAAIAQELARRDMTNDSEIAPLMPRYVEAAEKMGTAEAVFNNRPDLMPPREIAAKPATATSPAVAARMETPQETMARAVGATKNEVVSINAQAFHVTNLTEAQDKLGNHVTQEMLNRAVLALSPGQLGTLGADTSAGSQDRQKNITDGIRMLAAPFRSAVPNPATGLFELDKAALQAAATALHKPELLNLEKIVNHMKSNPNWVNVFN